MRFQEVGEVWGRQVVECFVGDEEYFEVDSLFDGQPVEIMEFDMHQGYRPPFNDISISGTHIYIVKPMLI